MPDLPFLDSFEHYLTADSTQKWTSGNAILAGVGRRGNPAMQVSGSGAFKTFNNEYSTLYMGAAFQNPGNDLFRVYNDFFYSGLLSGVNVALHAVGDGRLSITGTDPTNLSLNPPPFWTAVSSFAMLAGAWYYVEFKAEIAGNDINVTVKVNENQVLSASATFADPSRFAFGHKAWASVNVQGRGGGLSTYVGDLYVDTAEFYGDIIVGVIRPNGDGGSSMWIPSPAVTNYLNVKDITPDYDTTTVSTTLVNDLDLYTMEDIPTGIVVRAIQGVASVKKDTAGLAALKLQYGSGGGAVFSDEYFPSQVNYTMVRDGRKDILSPAAINALVFGQIRTQ